MIDFERNMIAKMRFPMFTTKSADLEETNNCPLFIILLLDNITVVLSTLV